MMVQIRIQESSLVELAHWRTCWLVGEWIPEGEWLGQVRRSWKSAMDPSFPIHSPSVLLWVYELCSFSAGGVR